MFRNHSRIGSPFRRFGSKSRNTFSSGEVTLQITSLVDIFTILLVFLLKTTASSDVGVTPSAPLSLAGAGHSDALQAALKIQISEEAVLVDELSVLTLTDGKLSEDTTPFRNALETHLNRQREIASLTPESAGPSARALIFADKKTPSQTLVQILALLEDSGFTALQIGTLAEEGAL
jgi:biopolymer transport protein ExbD